jgi:hypothetical protein
LKQSSSYPSVNAASPSRAKYASKRRLPLRQRATFHGVVLRWRCVHGSVRSTAEATKLRTSFTRKTTRSARRASDGSAASAGTCLEESTGTTPSPQTSRTRRSTSA